jgi:MraZ protein
LLPGSIAPTSQPCAPLNFSGTYDHSLDVKNRLTVPAKARAALADGVTIVRSGDGCLQLWPTTAYEAAAEQQLAGVSPFTERGKKMRRYLYGLATQTELDKAGRVGLPAPTLSHAGLTKEATLVGGGLWLEVWDPTRYAANDAALIDEAADLFSDGFPA